jgi:hypothetical protein
LRLLRAASVAAALAPPAHRGLPALIKGDRAVAARLVRASLERLALALRRSGGPLPFLSHSRLWMVSEFWPEPAPGEAASEAAKRACDAGGFLLGRHPPDPTAPFRAGRRRLALQASCHLRLAQSSLPAFGMAALFRS